MTGDTVFNQVGGQEFFNDLVDRFYRRVERDPVLRPLYPENLEPGKQALALFLGQYWGGPRAYSDTKGHPRLRMRHMPFVIGPPERDAWFTNMNEALDETAVSPEIKELMSDYFSQASSHLINQTD